MIREAATSIAARADAEMEADVLPSRLARPEPPAENVPVQLFDAHAHLQDAGLADGSAGVLERARAAGVQRVVVNGTTPRDWTAVSALAARWPEVAPAYGVHPWFLRDLPEDWMDDLAQRLTDNPAATVGEIGLDFAIEPRDIALQESIFLAQLRWRASATGR
jgi:TatD DNase family protein